MIGKAMATTVAATMLIGSATVLADERTNEPMFTLTAIEEENRPVPRRNDWNPEAAPLVVIPDPDDDTYTPRIIISEEPDDPESYGECTFEPASEPENNDDSQTTQNDLLLTIGIVNIADDDSDLPYHSGDIIRIGSEPVEITNGSYRLYLPDRESDYYSFTDASFRIYNRKLLMDLDGVRILLGDFVGFGVLVRSDKTIELHPLTRSQVPQDAENHNGNYPEIPYYPENPQPLVIEYAGPEPSYSVEATELPTETGFIAETPATSDTPAAVETSTVVETPSAVEAPAAVAAPSAVPSAPAAVSDAPASASAPASLVAGAVRPGVEGFVDRLYANVLNRDADPAGRAFWINLLNSKQKTGTEVADGFFNSAEFASRNLDNEQFVTTLYSVFFDRKPSSAEIDNWVNALNGGSTRSQVIAGFTSSAEWANTCMEYAIEA